MKIEDVSIRTRIRLSNFIMSFFPVMLVVTACILILVTLQPVNTLRAGIVSLVWPESGPRVAIQFELSRLRVRADAYTGQRLDELQDACRRLEEQGLIVAVYQDKRIIYATAGTSPWQTAALAREETEYHPSGSETAQIAAASKKAHSDDTAAMTWDANGIAYRYLSHKTGVQIAAVSNVQMQANIEYVGMSYKHVMKALIYMLFASVFIIIMFLGIALSKQLAGRIVHPLEELRDRAESISQGDLSKPLAAIHHADEIGDTCRAFESMRQQLQEAAEMREAYDKSRQELIAGVSHDLATPLTKIEGYAYGLLDGIAKTPEKQKHYLQMIIDTASAMELLVRTLLLYSKFDLGKVEFHWEDVDVCEYLSDYLQEQKEHLHRQGLDVSYEAAVPCGCGIIAMDRVHFQRVVDNIISNCVKYTGRAGSRLVVSTALQDDHILLRFADDGAGVPQEELPQLFDSFYRADKARSNTAKGSGLGLSVVRRIIMVMNGTIWAETTIPQGLTICISLPVQRKGEHR